MGICASKEENPRGKRDTKRQQKGGRNNDKKNQRKNIKGGRQRRNQNNSPSDSESETNSENSQNSDSEGNNNEQNDQKIKVNTTTNLIQDDAYPPISQADMDILFYKAFVCTSFAPTQISTEVLRNAIKLALLAPSAYNCCPMRVVFINSQDGKEKLSKCCSSEEEKKLIFEAPVTALLCTDKYYTRNLPKLMPYVPNAQQMFEQYEDLNEMIRVRNSNLQAGYLILAIRSLGMAVGPISGLNTEKADELFLTNTDWHSSLFITLGYPKEAPESYTKPSHTLSFDVGAKLLG